MTTHHDAGFKLRLTVRLRCAKLDEQIAGGRPYESTAALSLRAHQLVDPVTRRRIARSLRGVVEYVDRAGSGRMISAVVIERASVRAGREALLGLAERLDGAAPVTPRGVASVQMLLTDGLVSPLFNPHCGRTVVQAVWEAADLLGADAPTIGFGAVAI